MIDIIDGLNKIIDKDQMSKLDIDDALDISYMAKGQNKNEILEYYGIEEKDLNPEDAKFLNIVITRSKTVAKAEATKAFFDSMQDSKQAASTALSYLTRFSDDWNTPDAVDAGKEKFVFKMVRNG